MPGTHRSGTHRSGTLSHAETPIGFECWGDHDTAIDVPTSAGDVVVFSSLSPHATRVNTTGGPGAPRPQDDGDRQFEIVRDGALVPPD